MKYFCVEEDACSHIHSNSPPSVCMWCDRDKLNSKYFNIEKKKALANLQNMNANDISNMLDSIGAGGGSELNNAS